MVLLYLKSRQFERKIETVQEKSTLTIAKAVILRDPCYKEEKTRLS